ncbi:DUF4867 family protein [Feifania hominis]|uniref:DUF4867 family protein n=1 Tax=Feifania hominis TaxID=2763660 RepID=A0A926HQ94_9FIRM|nr:DUF4867 family protein [Feifania hominis]MBC8536102.1 DUF4867 family protein [Feifania hominis]
MDQFQRIQQLNPDLTINHIKSTAFAKYGRVYEEEFDTSVYLDFLAKKVTLPKNTPTSFFPNAKKMTKCPASVDIARYVFGGLNIQVGYSASLNSRVNQLEYHKTSEVSVGLNDHILFLGDPARLFNNRFDTGDLEIFYVPADTLYELYPRVLHSMPCKVSAEGCRNAVINLDTAYHAPSFKGTYTAESKILILVNTWLIAHRQTPGAAEAGIPLSLDGENIEIRY